MKKIQERHHPTSAKAVPLKRFKPAVSPLAHLNLTRRYLRLTLA
ncbi:hypothetical protein O9929_05010 [Vibrio lentus]|nr:hypothetical protein [Vibrio lentus]